MARRKGQQFPGLLTHIITSGRAFADFPIPGTRRRKRVYFGTAGTPESAKEYQQYVARLAASPTRCPLLLSDPAADLTLNELFLRFLKHAEATGVDADGERSSIAERTKYAIRKPVELYGSELASAFGPKALQTTMDGWVKEGHCRKYVNQQAQQIRAIFRWAVAEELLPPSCFERLKAVAGLRKGKTVAPDRPKVKPASQADLDKVLPKFGPAVAAIVRLMVHSGARCGELVKLTPADIDRSSDVWTYQPNKH